MLPVQSGASLSKSCTAAVDVLHSCLPPHHCEDRVRSPIGFCWHQKPENLTAEGDSTQSLLPQKRWFQLNSALTPPAMSDPAGALSTWFQGMLETGARARLPRADQSGLLPPSELVNVPMLTWCSLGMHELARAKNAKHFSRRPGDAASETALQSVGEQSAACWSHLAPSYANSHPWASIASCKGLLEGQLAEYGRWFWGTLLR